MVLVEIFGLQIEASSGLPIVLLREVDDPHRVLPIFIGGPEALAIARGLQGVSSDRPLTHDLLVELLERTGNHLEEVAVTELRDGTFFAELRLGSNDGRHVLSSRPSDAIALAVRLGAPVYASEEVLDEAGAVLRQADELEAGGDPEAIEEVVEEFREFLDELNPADFLGGTSAEPRPTAEGIAAEGREARASEAESREADEAEETPGEAVTAEAEGSTPTGEPPQVQARGDTGTDDEAAGPEAGDDESEPGEGPSER
jgi:bifunctional DNase/RNase